MWRGHRLRALVTRRVGVFVLDVSRAGFTRNAWVSLSRGPPPRRLYTAGVRAFALTAALLALGCGGEVQVITSDTDGGDPDAARRMGPGSFYSISAGTAHVSACVSEAPCIAYLHQDGAFDFLPVQQ